MAVTPSTTSTLNNLLSTYFEKRAIPRLVAKAQLYQIATKYPLPKGEGVACVFNAWSNFAPASAALTEATTPDAATVSSRKVTATVAQYGRVVRVSDIVEFASSLDIISGTVDNLTDSASLSVDRVIQTAIFKSSLARNTDATILSAWMSARVSAFASGSNGSASTLTWGVPVVMGTTATRLSAVSKTAPSVSARLSMYSIKKAVKAMQIQNVMPFADGYLKLVTNSDAANDLRTDPDFKEWFKYTNPTSAEKGDVMVPVEGCRILMSNNIPKYRATAHNCDLSIIIGEGALACTSIGAGNGFEIKVKRPNDGDTSNPLDLYMTLGYKISMAAAATNTSAIRVLATHAKP